VSRLHGHSSSSGALLVADESDCITVFERKMLEAGVIDRESIKRVHREAEEEASHATDEVVKEPRPTPEDVQRFTYAPSTVDAVYPNDYTGLP
jgi:2-oxoisovalerate dehydrogenase E1 component alpha subunit